MRLDRHFLSATSSSEEAGGELSMKATSEAGIDSMSSLTPSAFMIHAIDPIVKIWLGCGRDEELAECTILFNIETARTP